MLIRQWEYGLSPYIMAMRSNQEFYESENTIQKMVSQYCQYKESQFSQYVFQQIPLKGIILEVGGGTGFHGKIFSQNEEIFYVHSDYSSALCAHARQAGLRTIRVDGLNLAFKDGSIDILIAIELSTIIHNECTRFKQFDEFCRALKKNGYLIIETGLFKKGLHHLNRKDIQYLKSLGLKKIRIGNWGVIPGRFWDKRNSRVFNVAERVMSFLGIGIRRVARLQKR